MLKTLLARFSGHTAAFVSGEQQQVFEGCMTALAAHPKIDEMMSDEHASYDDFWPAANDWRSAYRPYIVREGILQIPVRGVLLHDFGWQAGSYATGYPYIWKAFERGMDDPEVKGIALIIHSPGGEVAGNFDLVDRMYERRGEKPIRAFAHEYAYSAAYSIASVADHIAMSRTGGVGSIGVVTSHVDVSAMMEEIGWKITFIYAGRHKVDGNPYEALAPDVKTRIQSRVNGLYNTFVATVARNRGMEESAVRGTEALTFSPEEAVSNGLADSVGALDDAVAAFAADLSANKGDEQMSKQDNTAVDQAALDTARAEGRAEGHAAGHAEGLSAGATAERDRISAILASDEGQKRPVAAMAAALDSDMSVEKANTFLGKLPEESAKVETTEAKPQGNAAFTEAMNNGNNPNVGSEGGDADQDEDAKVVAFAQSMNLPGMRKRS